MNKNFGKRLRNIINPRLSLITPDRNVEKIIQMIDENMASIERYFINSIHKGYVNSDDLKINTLIINTGDDDYWRSHSEYIRRYFDFSGFYFNVKYDGTIAFTIYP